MSEKERNIEAKTIGVVADKVGSVTINKLANRPSFPKKLTTRIPSFPWDDIVGREAELEDLHRQLNDGRSMLLVNGMGGVGKNCLAQAYADKYRDQYHHIAWLSQNSDDWANDVVSTPGFVRIGLS